MLRVEKGWVEVCKGEFEGWMSVNGLWNVIEEKTTRLAPLSRTSESDFEGRQPILKINPVQGFMDFLTGNYEQRRKMNDPHYRDRITSISSEWGPLYHWSTRQCYVKGIYLVRLLDDRVRIGLAKRRFSYGHMLGGLWSDEFIDRVLKANRGWLRNREIFGRGREYFLGLSYHF